MWKLIHLILLLSIVFFLFYLVFAIEEQTTLEFLLSLLLFFLIGLLDFIVAKKVGYSTIAKVHTAFDKTTEQIGKPFHRFATVFHSLAIVLGIIGLSIVVITIGYLLFLQYFG